MGAVRDPEDANNWKWINGLDVTVSFWNLPGGNENCARFDGTKGWLWSDTNCNFDINFICQHSKCQIDVFFWKVKTRESYLLAWKYTMYLEYIDCSQMLLLPVLHSV